MDVSRPIELSDASFDAEVLRSDRPVLVDFWAPWCPPCRALGPTIEGLARDLGDGAKVAKVNVDENPGTAAALGVSSLPTVLVFRGGEEVDRIVGLQARARYEQALARASVA